MNGVMDSNGWFAWDINHDCVVNDLDFWFFAKDWMTPNRGGETTSDEYDLQLPELSAFLRSWLECRGRTNQFTNSGCAGW